METEHFWWKTNIQLLPSFEVNIENCQPEDGCFPRELHNCFIIQKILKLECFVL